MGLDLDVQGEGRGLKALPAGGQFWHADVAVSWSFKVKLATNNSFPESVLRNKLEKGSSCQMRVSTSKTATASGSLVKGIKNQQSKAQDPYNTHTHTIN